MANVTMYEFNCLFGKHVHHTMTTYLTNFLLSNAISSLFFVFMTTDCWWLDNGLSYMRFKCSNVELFEILHLWLHTTMVTTIFRRCWDDQRWGVFVGLLCSSVRQCWIIIWLRLFVNVCVFVSGFHFLHRLCLALIQISIQRLLSLVLRKFRQFLVCHNLRHHFSVFICIIFSIVVVWFFFFLRWLQSLVFVYMNLLNRFNFVVSIVHFSFVHIQFVVLYFVICCPIFNSQLLFELIFCLCMCSKGMLATSCCLHSIDLLRKFISTIQSVRQVRAMYRIQNM